VPATTTTTTPVTLPFTGTNGGTMTGFGLVLILAGGGLIALSYRRRVRA
jgi:LPXTG-motif cell wall-anchored protein